MAWWCTEFRQRAQCHMELFVSALQMLAMIAFTKEKYGCRKQAQQHTHTHTTECPTTVRSGAWCPGEAKLQSYMHRDRNGWKYIYIHVHIF